MKGKLIKMAGLLGGGLPIITEDGWCLESVTINFPETMILLVEPGSDLYGMTWNKPDNLAKIDQQATIRAYGFSYTGQSFIVATSSDVSIYNRSNKLS